MMTNEEKMTAMEAKLDALQAVLDAPMPEPKTPMGYVIAFGLGVLFAMIVIVAILPG